MDNEFDAFLQKDEAQGQLDTPDYRLRKKLCKLINHSGQGEDQQEDTENDPRGTDYRFSDECRISDGYSAHRLQRLHRYRQTEVISGNQVEEPEGQEDRRRAQFVDENHGHDNGQQGAQIAEGAGQFDPVEPKVSCVGRAVAGLGICGKVCPLRGKFFIVEFHRSHLVFLKSCHLC